MLNLFLNVNNPLQLLYFFFKDLEKLRVYFDPLFFILKKYSVSTEPLLFKLRKLLLKFTLVITYNSNK